MNLPHMVLMVLQLTPKIKWWHHWDCSTHCNSCHY